MASIIFKSDFNSSTRHFGMQSIDNLQHIGSDKAFTHYEERVRTLTLLLDKQACHTPVSNTDPENEDVNEELRFFCNLATLLTTGCHGENCAVTALLLPGIVKCIVVDTSETQHDASTSSVHLVREGCIGIKELGSAA
jgi:hypothetical protein